MKYYQESTGLELNVIQVRKALSPSILPKNFTPEQVVSASIYPIIEQDPPVVTALETIESVIENIGGKYYRVWDVVSKFKDIPGGLTKVTQEVTFIIEELIRVKKAKLTEMAKAQFAEEISGVAISDTEIISTDRESQAMLTGAWVASQIDPTIEVNWKGKNNKWKKLKKADIVDIASVVFPHVQASFTKEMLRSQEIAVAETVADVLAITWV